MQSLPSRGSTASAVRTGVGLGWTGARAVTLGKPSSIALREMCRVLRSTPARTAVVGDDLDLEIAMGRRLRSPTALVLTGISSRADAAARPPSVVLPDVTAFPGLLEA